MKAWIIRRLGSEKVLAVYEGAPHPTNWVNEMCAVVRAYVKRRGLKRSKGLFAEPIKVTPYHVWSKEE